MFYILAQTNERLEIEALMELRFSEQKLEKNASKLFLVAYKQTLQDARFSTRGRTRDESRQLYSLQRIA